MEGVHGSGREEEGMNAFGRSTGCSCERSGLLIALSPVAVLPPLAPTPFNKQYHRAGSSRRLANSVLCIFQLTISVAQGREIHLREW